MTEAEQSSPVKTCSGKHSEFGGVPRLPREGGTVTPACLQRPIYDSRIMIHQLPTSDLRPLTSLRVVGSREPEAGFTVMELLVVTGIIAILMTLLAPAFTNLKSGGDVTSALSAVSGTLEQARTYAMANNTYVWVGFYEEASSNPGTAGRGRIIMSVIASKDGTQIFDPSSSPSSTNKLDGTKVVQLGKLIKIENMHLGDVANPNLTNNTLWDQRPGVTSTGPPVMVCRIGDTNPTVGGQPSTTLFPFQYPVGSPLPTAQYTFTKTVQFNPRGESNLNSTYSTVAWIEIGVQPAHGDSPDLSMAKNAAVQVAGFTGDVKIYQR